MECTGSGASFYGGETLKKKGDIESGSLCLLWRNDNKKN